MNRAVRAPFLLTWKGSPLPSLNAAAATALFHSTPVLERRRNSQFRFNSYATRFRRKEAKRMLLRDANLYLEHLLEGGSWSSQHDDPQSMSSDYTSWFERQYFGKGGKKKNFHTQGFQWASYPNRRKGSSKLFWNDTDDEESETTIFGSAFGRTSQGFYRPFSDEDLGRGSSRRRQRRVSWNWKDETDDEYFWRGYSRSGNQRTSYDRKDESRNDDDTSTKSVMASDRLTLGLTATGPLKLEEVKSAYRACALRWHPDRHQGSSKVAAEEKFKYCTAAYKSICDKLELEVMI